MLSRTRWLALALLMGAAMQAGAKEKAPMPAQPAKDLPFELILGQKDIAVEFDDAGGDGLAYALRAKAAEGNADLIRGVSGGGRVDAGFEERLRKLFESSLVGPPRLLNVVAVPWSEEEVAAHTQATDGVYFAARPFVAMNGGAIELRVRLYVSQYRLQPGKNGKLGSKEVFGRQYDHSFVLKDAKAFKWEDNARRWAALGPERLHALALAGLEQVVQMFEYDLSEAGRADALEPPGNNRHRVGLAVSYGRELRRTDEFIWVRGRGGAIHGIQSFDDAKPSP
jgi:hypothetical protein